MMRALLLMILSGSLVACGQRGPLVMPTPPQAPSVAKPAQASAPTQSSTPATIDSTEQRR